LVFVFLVILAGGVVRTTQSGMGCPDWPRCFGRWVPPVSEDQLPVDFEKYLSKQDIDHTFNVYHTWIEYINRLLGAVLGLLIIVHVFWSFRKYFKTRSSIFWLSLFLLLLTGFQGWLGKRVVDANLAVVKITTHMLVALLIAAVPVIIINKVIQKEKVENKQLKWFSTVALAAVILQIIFGTEVREQIDEISRSLNYQQRELWISRLNNFFILHRSFAWIVALLGVYLFWRSLGVSQLQKPAVWVFILILASMLLGLSMMYLHIPALAQPLHLLFSSL
jgi:cytochrome c oxidase assembly protein subunit 15